MGFRASFCGPLSPDITELGDIFEFEIINKFESIDWDDHLRQMIGLKHEEIHYSPSFEIQNNESRHRLAISAVGDPGHYEFYIFYKRPKQVKMLGLVSRIDSNYMTDIMGQTKQDVIDCLNALIRNDTDFLANKIGK